MNKVCHTVIISKYKESIVFALRENDKFVRFIFCDDFDFQLGTVFLSRIENNVKSLGALYVSLPDGKKGFYQGKAIKQGDLIPMMLIKEGTSTKAPLVSDEITITGLYSVVSSSKGQFRISKKINKEVSNKIYDDLYEVNQDRNIIIRTNSQFADSYTVQSEIDFLISILDYIHQYGSMRVKDNILYRPYKSYISELFSIPIDEIVSIITDIPSVYEEIEKEYISKLPDIYKIKLNVILHDNSKSSINAIYSLSYKIDSTLEKKVWLKSGGNIVIEQTEALVSIDVNSGKGDKNAAKEDNHFNTNIEAAIEIAYQLKLRNLSGIIIVDFINISKAKQIELEQIIKKELSKDYVKCIFYGFTSLGLAQINREKKTISIPEHIRNITRKKEN